MTWLERCGGRLPERLVAVALGVWSWSGPFLRASEGEPVIEGVVDPRPPIHRDSGAGTLGYGPPGLHPGFQGFGPSFHLGYGYGGKGLGVGSEGGYPWYGGSGYPHEPPALRRFGRIEPFPYCGRPANPVLGYPYQFAGFGPRVDDIPIVFSGPDHIAPAQSTDFGPFTGAAPDAVAAFAPFVMRDSASGPSRDSNPASTVPGGGPDIIAPIPPALQPAGDRANSPAPVLHLGIDEEPFVEGWALRGLKVASVHPGSPAEKAGLQPGDVIRSMNGHPTTRLGNLAWIIANAAPDKVLRVNVLAAADRKERALTAQLP